MNPDQTLNTEEAAAYLKVSVNTLANWRSQKMSPKFYAPRGKVIYYKHDLDEWIRANGEGGKDE